MLFFFLGLLLLFLAVVLVAFTLIWWIQGTFLWGFLLSSGIFSLVGSVALISKKSPISVKSHLGYLVAFLCIFPFFLALPFWIDTPLSFTQSLFEAVATVTLSGYSHLTGNDIPSQVTYLRGFAQWFSGGLILFIMISLHGRKNLLYPGESIRGLMNEYKNPLVLYCLATAGAFTFLLLCDLTLSESFFYSLGTVSTGGFTPYQGSVGALNNVNAEGVIAIFMFLSVLGYTVYGSFGDLSTTGKVSYFYFPALILLASVFVGFLFWNNGWEGFFYFASSASTTGYFLNQEVGFMPLIYALMTVGGCYGSLTGGLHINTVVEVVKKLRDSPRKVFSQQSDSRGIKRGSQFFVSYMLAFVCLCLALSASGMDFLEVIDLCIKTLSNSAPMNNEQIPSSNYQQVILMCSMVLGRLSLVYLLAFFFIYKRELKW